ncbi:MAG: hypothetical protein ACHRHE_16470 [Tepidisphaerales bacterium]
MFDIRAFEVIGVHFIFGVAGDDVVAVANALVYLLQWAHQSVSITEASPAT